MPLTIEVFLELLEKSKLLTPEQLHEAKGTFEEEPVELAKELIRDKVLTKWQAQQLLAGRSLLKLGNYRLVEKLGEGGMGAV